MKMYKRGEFIKLPRGTVYSRVLEDDLSLFYGLFCKISGKEYTNDFVEQDLISEPGFPLAPDNNDGFDNIQYQLHRRDNFLDFRTDLHCAGRDGMYEENDLFVVWDNEDITKLINYLSECIKK